MPKLEDFQQQQELNLFFSTTVPSADSPEGKKLVAEAPYHPGYEGAAFSTITIPPLTTQDISGLSLSSGEDVISLNSWGAQPIITTNIDPTPTKISQTWDSFFNINTNKDSGGALKFDSDKMPVNLLSTEALMQTAAVLKFGADKYAEHNWRAGFAWSRPLAAAMRHIMAFNDGEDKDPESGLSHLAHAMCCIMFLLEFEKTHRELDDRYKVDVPATKDTSK
jgi:Domain of unknown function (DUF5664)